MKLLYITNAINGAGGLERVLSIKASYLADKLGYQVHILTLNNIGQSLFYTFSPNIILHTITVQGNPLQYAKNYYQGIRSMIALIQPNRISVCDDGLKGFFIPRIIGCKIPIIYERHVSKEIEMHHGFSFFRKNFIKMKWQMMEYLAKDFNAFIVLTDGNKKEWSSLKNLRVIPNPLSFYPNQSSNLENKKVIAVGKQSYQKGYDLLLQAWQIVHNQHPDWHLEIYGKKEMNENLDTKAKKLGINKSVSLLDPEKNIQEKYLDCSIYVMSSRYEGFGMVLIEAMACGVPCVSFNCNYGPADIITNDEDGFVVEKENYKALAFKMVLLIEDKPLREQMGQLAKNNVKRFLPQTVLMEWDRLFKSQIV